MAGFNVDGFDGTVHLLDWVMTLDGKQARCFSGRIRILEASTVVGFRIRHSPEANWIARVEGPTQSYNFPGCKVAAVIEHSSTVPAVGDRYVVP